MRVSQALARPWRRGCAQSPSAMRRSARCAPAVMYAEALFTRGHISLCLKDFHVGVRSLNVCCCAAGSAVCSLRPCCNIR